MILNTDNKYTYGGGYTSSGSGYGKNVDNFKNNYVFGGESEINRKYISNLIKKTFNLDDEEYLKFVKENKNKAFSEIMPVETRNKLIKAFASINSDKKSGERDYDEMYISNPTVMGVFAYPKNEDNKISNTMDFVQNQKDFLKEYAIKKDIPMIVFGE